MATISIEGGCVKLSENTYVYNYADTVGVHTNIFFTDGAVPKVGDSIVDGMLVPLTEPKINPDSHLWVDGCPDHTWGN